MTEEFDRELQAAKSWALTSKNSGWLSEADIAPLLALENRSPSGLFDPGIHRPLVAAFFGGTGVGKSSLLNRLAGKDVARVGVERPTSREVSVYVHESLHIRQLPRDFPLDRVRVARHGDENRRQVMWIDMPDIDSTETVNRELVVDWLPHIDVLIYVVSPERYRDDKGWSLLREHVREHAWLFVMNQWDLGQEPQVAHFIRLLKQGGFADPLVFKTDCREEAEKRKPDEFEKLENFIQSLAHDHLIEQLERRALDARREELWSAVQGCLAKLGEKSNLEGLRAHWRETWADTTESLRNGLKWPISEVARAFVTHDASPLSRPIRLVKPEKHAKAGKSAPPSILWDDWAQMQLQDALDRMMVEAGEQGFPIAPLQSRISELTAKSTRLMMDDAQRALRSSLANPGNVVQRLFLKLTSFLAVVLPLCALGWVSWQAVTAYYESALRHTGFLGLDFAVHSTLVVAIAWTVPFFIRQQLKPSNERAAEKGLHNGVNSALARIQMQVEEALSEYEAERSDVEEQGRKLMVKVRHEFTARSELLERMLPGSNAS